MWGDEYQQNAPEPLKTYEWTCPECKKLLKLYGEASLKTMKELHIGNHERAKELWDLEQKNKSLTTPKDYNTLDLTVADKAFLKTRGVKVD